MRVSYRIKDLWWHVRDWFNPKQKWLTSKIPNRWMDKDQVWEICILEGIKHYVEGECGLGKILFRDGKVVMFLEYDDIQRSTDYPDYQKEFDCEVKWAYDQITINLPKLMEEEEKEWIKIRSDKKNLSFADINNGTKADYDRVYGEKDRLEKEIEDLKTKVMVWAVTNRAKIWT
jgi:hypothetical protein